MGFHDDYQKGFNSGASNTGGLPPSNVNEQVGFAAGQQQRALDDKRIAESNANYGPEDASFTIKVFLVLIAGGGIVASVLFLEETSPLVVCASASSAGFFLFLIRGVLGRFGPVLICGLAGLALESLRLVITGGYASFENLWFSTSLGVVGGLVLSALKRRR